MPQPGPRPESRDSHSCARIGNKMYIFGGSTQESLINELWTFSFEKNTWRKLETHGTIPPPREGHSACVIDDHYMLIIGGWNSDTEKIFDEIFLFDTNQNEWRLIENK